MDKETMDFLKGMFTDMQSCITKLINELHEGFKTVNERLVKLEIGQEQLTYKLEIIAEVQQKHMSLNEKQHQKIVETLTGNLEITENVVRLITRVK
jgi:hypothetical protein